MKSLIKKILLIIVLIVVFLGFGEFYVRAKDYRVNRKHEAFVTALNHISDPTSCITSDGNLNRPKRALVVGCSFTFGQSVEDSKKYVSLLNDAFPDCLFENAGARGWGALVSLFRERQLLAKNKYDLVLFAPLSNHIYREKFASCQVLNRTSLEKSIYEQYDDSPEYFPLDGDNGQRVLAIKFHGRVWPFDNISCLVNTARLFYVETFGGLEGLDRNISHANALRFRLACMMRSMQSMAQRSGAKFGIAALYGFNYKGNDDSPDYDPNPIEYYLHMPLWEGDTNNKVIYTDVSYPRDFQKVPMLNCGPEDPTHPNAIVHKYYAEKITEWIRAEHLLD